MGASATLTRGPATVVHKEAPGRGGSDERQPSQRPEDHPVGRPTDLPAGEHVPELVEQHDPEHGHVLERAPQPERVIGHLAL